MCTFCMHVCHFRQRVLFFLQSALAYSHVLDHRHSEWYYTVEPQATNVYFDPAVQPKHVRDYLYQIYLYLSASFYKSNVGKKNFFLH